MGRCQLYPAAADSGLQNTSPLGSESTVMNAKAKGTLLVVDDEAEIREIVEMHVAPLGIRVIEAGDGQQALEAVRQHHVDVIVSDLMMPRMTGLGLLSALRDSGFMKPFIFLTAYPSQDSTLQALRL